MMSDSKKQNQDEFPAKGTQSKKQAWVAVVLFALTVLSCNFPLLQPRSTPALPTVTVEPTPTPSQTALPTLMPTETPVVESLGGKIVYVCFVNSYDQICIVNANKEESRQLTSETATNFYPSLSPGGNRIVFSSRRDGNFEIYEMDTTGGDLTRLTNNIGSLYAPEISPNESTIVFTNDSGGRQHIWLMERDGSNPRPLTSGDWDDLDPTWSPDGLQIAFASNRTGSTQLFTMLADGSNVRQVTDVAWIGGRSTWSPDGRSLAFYAGLPAESDRNLFVVALDDSYVRQITQGGDNLGPSYSPDGNWLAFTSYRNGNNDIWIIRTDGSQSSPLTQNLRSEWQPRWGP